MSIKLCIKNEKVFSFMIQVLIEQVNTLAVLTLNCPLKIIIASFENSREAF